MPRLAHSHAVFWVKRLLWIYCSGHAGVSGNEEEDRLAITSDITSGLLFGRAEVLRGSRNFLNMNRPEHHNTDRLKEKGEEKGNDRHSFLRGMERSVSTRQTLPLFRGQPRGDCRETGRSAYGPFRAIRCHLELKVKL